MAVTSSWQEDILPELESPPKGHTYIAGPHVKTRLAVEISAQGNATPARSAPRGDVTLSALRLATCAKLNCLIGKANPICPHPEMASYFDKKTLNEALNSILQTGHVCGPVRGAPGPPVQDIVVAGGYGSDDQIQNTVLIFNIGTASWTSGKYLTNDAARQLNDQLFS